MLSKLQKKIELIWTWIQPYFYYYFKALLLNLMSSLVMWSRKSLRWLTCWIRIMKMTTSYEVMVMQSIKRNTVNWQRDCIKGKELLVSRMFVIYKITHSIMYVIRCRYYQWKLWKVRHLICEEKYRFMSKWLIIT